MNRTVLITLGITSSLVSAELVVGALPATAADTARTRTNGTRLSRDPDITPDGRFVVFSSKAPRLVPGDTGDGWDVFVRDLRTGTTSLVSATPEGRQGNRTSGSLVWDLDSAGAGGSPGSVATGGTSPSPPRRRIWWTPTRTG